MHASLPSAAWARHSASRPWRASSAAIPARANARPFLYFPLGQHFEQNFHVRHRLERYRAGRAMDFATDGPEEVAAAIAEEIGREVDYAAVDPGGAARASIAELL